MFKTIFWTCLLLVLIQGFAFAGQHNFKGMVRDSLDVPLPGVSVALLDPHDSTLVGFSITNQQGAYSLTAVGDGNYLLQVALMGYYTYYKPLSVDETTDADLGTQVLQLNPESTLLDAVVVSGEKIPVRLKGDTIEYNAGSFQVKQDAVVEDLLKKMPGIQVDKNGNIAAMGKQVTRILVDGKEFFGDDPKVATKNLPADAVDKIQSFDKKSDASLFSGIDDGLREQTLNVVLKSGKKTGYFGSAHAGGGYPKQYESLLKAFKFRQKSQLATMGMFNNINKFGFTFEDYFNFNGGLKSLTGGEIRIDSDELPVDLGQPVTGDVGSGALTLNYMLEPNDHDRVTVNYMGNGMHKLLDQETRSRNFLPGGSFNSLQEDQNKSSSLVNRASVKWRRQTESALITSNVYGLLKNNEEQGTSQTRNDVNTILENYQDNANHLKADKSEFAGDFNWMKKQKKKWPVIKAGLQGNYKQQNGAEQWRNNTTFSSPFAEIRDAQYRNERGYQAAVSAQLSAVRALSKGYFLEPLLQSARSTQSVSRLQGPAEGIESVTDSLSPSFLQQVTNLNAELELKKIGKRERWGLTVKRADVWLNPSMNGQQWYNKHYAYWLPAVFWEREPKMGTRLRLSYKTSVNTPGADQLLPVADYRNPLVLSRGNPNLVPEYHHRASAVYASFDQYNMATFSAGLQGNFTRNNITYSRNIAADLSQQLEYVNTPYQLSGQADLAYSRPVEAVGLSLDLRLNETWAQSISPVNGINNRNNTLTHTLDLNFNNTKNNVWDLRWGAKVSLSGSRYSVNKEMNNKYNNYSGYAQLSYRPAASWNISTSGEITHYTAGSFGRALTIPLLGAELSHYIFANRRGAISLKAFDILDKNRAVERISQLNYLMERKSNTIGRYIMLSFSYRLNKSGNAPGSVKLQP